MENETTNVIGGGLILKNSSPKKRCKCLTLIKGESKQIFFQKIESKAKKRQYIDMDNCTHTRAHTHTHTHIYMEIIKFTREAYLFRKNPSVRLTLSHS